MKDLEVKTNHKMVLTELGEIPVDWKVELLDKVAVRKSGHTPDKKSKVIGMVQYHGSLLKIYRD
ncbi:hypothetical protein ACI2OX_21670 [Bacillus sp. N9]